MRTVETFNTLFIQPSYESIRREIRRKYRFAFILQAVVTAAALGIARVDGGISGDIVLTVLVTGIIIFAAAKFAIIPQVEQKALLLKRRSKGVFINGLFFPVHKGAISGFTLRRGNFRFSHSKDLYISDSIQLYPGLETVLQRWLTAEEGELPAGEIQDISYYHVSVRGVFLSAINAWRDKLDYSEQFHTLQEKEQERIKERYRKQTLWYLTLINGLPLLLTLAGIALYLPWKNIFDSFQQGLIWFVFAGYFFIFQNYSLLLLPPLKKYLQYCEDLYCRKPMKSR